MSQTRKNPHDPKQVYSQVKQRHWALTFPSLSERERGKGQMVIIALLLLALILGGIGLGFEIETTVLHPPKEVFGICQPPAYIKDNDCFINKEIVDANGTPTTVREKAGHIVIGNVTTITVTATASE